LYGELENKLRVRAGEGVLVDIRKIWIYAYTNYGLELLLRATKQCKITYNWYMAVETAFGSPQLLLMFGLISDGRNEYFIISHLARM
jgi:hypothetical protein